MCVPFLILHSYVENIILTHAVASSGILNHSALLIETTLLIQCVKKHGYYKIDWIDLRLLKLVKIKLYIKNV